MEYGDFLNNKLARVQPVGFDADVNNPGLWDWQASVTRWAIKTGRAALFEDCGLGKSRQQVVWADAVAKQTGDPVLIGSPLAVAPQTVREGVKVGIEVHHVEMDADVKPGVNITNYEKLNRFNLKRFGGFVPDESGILKSYMGKTKRFLVEAFRDTPYKLACTATPAPNDLMELLNHAEFLGVMRSSEALSIWFTADQSESGKYRLKGHAQKDFWRWVASWAVCISKPSDIGYSDEGYILPELTEIDEIIPVSEMADDWTDGMFRKIEMSATGFHAEKRRTLSARCARSAEIARSVPDEQFIIWTYQNDEADELKRLLPEAVEVRGNHSAEYKERAALDFVDGKFRVLISKPSIFGYGLNFQNCRNAVYNGLDYSFEGYYQTARRLWRFGQTQPVRLWRVLGSTEQNILNVINAKARQKEEMEFGMAQAMKDIQTAAVRGHSFKLDMTERKYSTPAWLQEAI